MPAAAKRLFGVFILCSFISPLTAQVYSPRVLRRGQADASSLKALAQSIYDGAGAVTDREKAEAIWRFFLTDGRFVKPGFWYHIAGWAYEEPLGEVLDPLKLLNSYGFGLCYHIAPLLEAVWEAGGFPDARVWFLTGHTVAEVFFDGAYHYYDSDMMGYTTSENGDYRRQPAASVRQIEQNGNILLGKLKGPTEVDKSLVDYPWYPADLREAAIGGLTELFTSTSDNWLYPFTRYRQGHSMDFVLRPGERLIRYFAPEENSLYYLPYDYDGKRWQEFPKAIASWRIRTEDGPKSQKDNRRWATGRIEYRPVLSSRASYYPAFRPGFNENLRLPGRGSGSLMRESPASPGRAVFEMPSPYVIIDARISLKAYLKESAHRVTVETSTDNGSTWQTAGALQGPYAGPWETSPLVKARSEHGVLTAVSGTYGYLVRLNLLGPGPADGVAVEDITIRTRFQLNPRTLPELRAGRNEMAYRPGISLHRRVIPVRTDQAARLALRAVNFRFLTEKGQGLLLPLEGKRAEFVFEVTAPDGSPLDGFDAGGRFLDIQDGLAPDKLTAEVRKTSVGQSKPVSPPEASIEWSTSPGGKYKTLWRYGTKLQWRDGKPIDRLLRWPEVDRQVRMLPAGTRRVYVRYSAEGMALDDIRLAAITPGAAGAGSLDIEHIWRENGRERTRVEHISKPGAEHPYVVEIDPDATVVNEAIILTCR